MSKEEESVHEMMFPEEESVQTEELRSMESREGLSLFDFVLGMERRKSEMRQTGGLLLILGSGAAHSALALTAVVIEGMGGRDQIKGFNLPVLVGSVLQCFSGFVSMVVGLNTVLSAPLNKKAHNMAKFSLIIGNLAPITIVFSIIRIIMGARQDPAAGIFVPAALEPTRNDNKLTALNGIVALISVCVTLLGGLTLLSSNLCAFIGGQCMSRNRLSYMLRYGYFCLLVTFGGWSQLLLGAFCWSRFGSGPYSDPVHVTVYTIFLPQLTCITGFVQMTVGLFGLFRVLGWSYIGGHEDHRFEFASLVSWLITMLLQIIVQPSYARGDQYDAEGATFASVYLGFFIIPVWLDYKVRVTPNVVWPEYYAISSEVKPKRDRLVMIFLFLKSHLQKHHNSDDVPKTDSDSSSESNGSERNVL